MRNMLDKLIAFLYWLKDITCGRKEKPLQKIGLKRSSRWPKVEKDHLQLEKNCQACTSKKLLNVHHIIPFHINPRSELDHENLITLCRRCHLLLGHLDCWSSYNANVRLDAAHMLFKITHRPKVKRG